MSVSKNAARAAAALTVVLVLAAIAGPAAAWRSNAIPVWTSPFPAAPWTFVMRLTNTGNSTMQVSGFTVWTNWGDPPTSSDPQDTSTSLPVAIAAGSFTEFSFTLNVPASAAAHQQHLDGKIVAEDQNGSGWTAPSSGTISRGFNFTVLSTPPSAPGVYNSPIPIYSIIVIALFAVSITLRIVVMRRRRAPPTMPANYAPMYYPPQPPPPPPGPPPPPPP